MTEDVMPVVAGAPVAQQRRDGVVVLQPLGRLDDALADELRLLALEAHAPVVIHLDRCTTFEASAIDRLASAWQLHRPQLSLVAGDTGDRFMLERLASTWSVAVFGRVDDAIEARRRGPDGWAARTGA
jgi:anti-anti-sigma regulatory factor